MRQFCIFFLFLATCMIFISCGPNIDYSRFEGTEDNPIEITTNFHSGFIGSDTYTSSSYYYFDSTKSHPWIQYTHVYPDQDLDIYVYSKPGFYDGLLRAEESMSGDGVMMDDKDYTGIRLYVKIFNYSGTEDTKYDIYYM